MSLGSLVARSLEPVAVSRWLRHPRRCADTPTLITGTINLSVARWPQGYSSGVFCDGVVTRQERGPTARCRAAWRSIPSNCRPLLE